ncbi:MAG: hypothetical protein ABI666_12395 [Ferruginibacter sp.]
MKKYTIPFFLLGSLVMVYVMTKTGATLKTPDTLHGILDLEFAYNTAKTTAAIDAWTPADNIAAAKLNTWLDFLFLFFYSPFLFFASKKIAQTFNATVAKAGHLIAKGALLAGFLDILENTGMLLTLNGHTSASIAFLTTFFSVIKWGLALIAVLYVLTGALVLAFRKIKN